MKIQKKTQRLRRARRTRAMIEEKRVPRLVVTRSNCNIRAQLIITKGGQHSVIATASSLEKELAGTKQNKTESAKVVGKALAERAQKTGVTQVAFDRSGYKYHGRIKALADAAREGGMQF